MCHREMPRLNSCCESPRRGIPQLTSHNVPLVLNGEDAGETDSSLNAWKGHPPTFLTICLQSSQYCVYKTFLFLFWLGGCLMFDVDPAGTPSTSQYQKWLCTSWGNGALMWATRQNFAFCYACWWTLHTQSFCLLPSCLWPSLLGGNCHVLHASQGST